jgi:hypothetical protein
LMLLMLKVATLTKSLSVPVLLGASEKEQPSSLFQLALFYRWKKMKKPNQNASLVQRGGLMSANLSKAVVDLSRNFSGRHGNPRSRPSHSSSGAEQRYTPRNVYCVFIEMCLEPCLKIRLLV